MVDSEKVKEVEYAIKSLVNNPTPFTPAAKDTTYKISEEEIANKVIERFGSPDKVTRSPEIIGLLNRIIINQEISRRSWERNNPLRSDEPVYDWAEETIDPGQLVSFTLVVPEGQVFFFQYFNITYNPNTVYNIIIDGIGDPTLPTLTDVLQDFGDHLPIFKPPKLCYRQIEITALNAGAAAQTYSAFIRGFFRQSIKLEE